MLDCQHLKKLAPEGISYIDNIKPNQNVIEGMENIVKTINEKIDSSVPPDLVDKYC